MTKGIELSEHHLKVKKLEQKINELERANLKLQEYFSKMGHFRSNKQISPFSGNPNFACVFNFTIDLRLQKLVWLNPDNKVLNYRADKLFLADTNTLTTKLIAKADRKRFKNIISQFTENQEQSSQTLLKLNHPSNNYIWVLACFEEVKFNRDSERYLQVQFIRLEENNSLVDLFNEFIKKTEKSELYQKIEMLTDRQREILALLGKGLTSKEIADILSISFHTVEAHRKSIARKTQTHKRAALISLASEVGIIR